MKVRYIGEEAQIGSRATLAFGRTWHIGEWVDVYEKLGDAYWSQFGAKISKNPFFEVEGGDEPSVAPAFDKMEENLEELKEVIGEPKPAKTPRKKKGA